MCSSDLFSTGFGVFAMQTRRNHAGIIQHQHVAGAEKFEQIRKTAMFDLVGFPMQNQQARGVAAFGRPLRDQPRREVEMKVSGAHRGQRNWSGRGLTIHSFCQL